MKTVLRVDGLCKSYGGFSLHDISFQLPGGRVLGLVGENGAGKTTLIKAIVGIVRKDAGRVELNGRQAHSEAYDIRCDVGYVPEDQIMYEWMTVARAIEFFATFYPSWDRPYGHYLQSLFQLDPKKKVKHLSKGMRVKLWLLLALAHRPKVLLLDEPTAGLDPIMRYELIQELKALIRADEEVAVLMSSHILSDVLEIADEIAFIHNGCILAQDLKVNFQQRWKKIVFDDDGASIDLAKIPVPVRYLKQSGRYVLLLESPEDLVVNYLKSKNITDMIVESPTLDEIFIAFVKGKVNHL